MHKRWCQRREIRYGYNRCIIKIENKHQGHKKGPKANKIENETKVLNDDNSKVDEMEEKYSKFLSKNKILRKSQKYLQVINTTYQL